MKPMFQKWILPLIGIILIIPGIILGTALISKKGFTMPAEFTEARASGAEIASFLNEFSDNSINSLEKIKEEDKAGRYGNALDITIKELERIEEARTKTIELLSELEKMAASIPSIPDDKAQSLGMQAISTEISLVDKLLNYNEKLKSLLDILKSKFTSYSPEQFNDEMTEITKGLNEDALSINELNRKYQTLMEEFDKEIKNQ